MPNTLSPKFQKGDRVRYTGKRPGWEDSNHIGRTGIVMSTGLDNVSVTWDDERINPIGVYPDNLELVVEPQAPIVIEGPFYVFPIAKDAPTYDTMDAATLAAQRYAAKGAKYGIFTGHKAFMIPKAIQEVPLAH